MGGVCPEPYPLLPRQLRYTTREGDRVPWSQRRHARVLVVSGVGVSIDQRFY